MRRIQPTVAGFRDGERGITANESEQLPEGGKGKDTDSPPELLKKKQPSCRMTFAP